MKQRTNSEVTKAAEDWFNGIIADLLYEHPRLRAAVDKMTKKEKAAWVQWLDSRGKELGEAVGSFFQTED